MNGDYETKYNGVNIKPSARKPLHSNCNPCIFTCPFPSRESMCSNGTNINDSNLRRTTMQKTIKLNDESYDEVDNKKKFPPRRRSIDSTKLCSEDSDNDDILSQSAPAIFQFYSYSREKSNEANSSGSLQYSTPEKCTTVVDSNKNPLNTSTSNISLNNIGSHVLESNKINTKFNKSSDCMQYLTVAISIIAAIVGYYSIYLNNINEIEDDNHIVYDKAIFFNDVTTLGQKYKVTDNAILKIKSGIATIFQRHDTGSFIFTYNSHHSNFDLIIFNNFINELASSTTRFLRKGSDIQEFVTVDSSKLDMRFHSELIKKYRNDVTKTGVMLVKDLDQVPSTLAMAFHYYCDEFNPLIKKSAIFFTLNLAKCSDQRTLHASIEKCLAERWTTVPIDNIGPLLTRVVGVVVDIYP